MTARAQMAMPSKATSTATRKADHTPTLILMGGSYRTCSSLNTDNCLPDKKNFTGFRQPSSYRIDKSVFPEILNPSYWQTRDRPPSISDIKNLLEISYIQSKGITYSSKEIISLFTHVDSKTWNSLLVLEQDMILSAFELPQSNHHKRLKEGVYLNGSIGGHDESMFKRFVQEASLRTPGKKPRIAFVTSAANNNFDAVDFYRELLQQAGAEVIWWPIDWSMNTAIFGQQNCQSLGDLRQQLFSQLGRERVFTDLAVEQETACAKPHALADLPNNVQGLFLDGGDQWLHQNTFLDANGQPNLWLKNIRSAFLKGDLVVAGTSAGTAIQSGIAMITNGTSSNALKRGAKIYGSVPEGCEQAQRCPNDIQEDDLTYWPGAGLSLVGPLLMDTHVSERKRELRFISLLAEVDVAAGIGIDETSAVMLKLGESSMQVEALGRSGAWWFMKPYHDNNYESVKLKAHYLAPGEIFSWQNNLLIGQNNNRYQASNAKQIEVTDAIKGPGLRDEVWNMVSQQQPSVELTAVGHRIQVKSSSESKQWQGLDGQIGITDLQIEIIDTHKKIK